MVLSSSFTTFRWTQSRTSGKIVPKNDTGSTTEKNTDGYLPDSKGGLLTSPVGQYLKKLLTHPLFLRIGAILLIFAVGQALAQVYDSTPSAKANESEQQLFFFLDIFNFVLTTLLAPAVLMSGWLLTSDWTMGDIFGLRPIFLQIWIIVSNFVYIAFACMLLAMAVIQIFGSGESSFALKKKLPRFLTGILIVPFTWLIVSWTLSFVNQAIAAVLSVPIGIVMDPKNIPKSFTEKPTIPKFLDYSFSKKKEGKETLICDNTNCITVQKFIETTSGPYFILLVFYFHSFSPHKIVSLSPTEVCGEGKEDTKACFNKLVTILKSSIFKILAFVGMFFLSFALCWVLLFRVFKLWIYIILSPLFGLAYAFGESGLGESMGGEGGGEGIQLGSLSLKSFFALAMVPVYVSAVIGFGFIAFAFIEDSISTASEVICTNKTFFLNICTKKGDDGMETIATIGSKGESAVTINFGKIDFGEIGNAVSEIKTGFVQIIMCIIVIGLMFAGIKVAVGTDEITKTAFEPFAKLAGSAANFAKHSVGYIGLPHPAQQLAHGINGGFAKMMDAKVAGDIREFEADFAGDMKRALSPELTAIRKAVEAAGKDPKALAAIAKMDDFALMVKEDPESFKMYTKATLEASKEGLPEEEKKKVDRMIRQLDKTSMVGFNGQLNEIIADNPKTVEAIKGLGGEAGEAFNSIIGILGRTQTSLKEKMKSTFRIQEDGTIFMKSDGTAMKIIPTELKPHITLEKLQSVITKDDSEIKTFLTNDLGLDPTEAKELKSGNAVKVLEAFKTALGTKPAEEAKKPEEKPKP